MRRMSCLLVCMMLSALCMADTAELLNPGFESMSGSPLAPDHWTLYTGHEATVFFAPKTDVVRTGMYSEKIAARNGYGMIYQEITSGFTPGETYSFWIYGRGDTNGDWAIDEPQDRIEFYAKFKNAGGGTISEPMLVAFDGDPDTAAPILVNNAWVQSSIFRFTVPEGTASILIKIQVIDSSADDNTRDGTSIYIDDVTLIKLPLPAQDPIPAADASEQDPFNLFLSWERGDDPNAAGQPDPAVTGYYVYVDQMDDGQPGEPNFLNPVYVTGTQYPAGAPGLAFGPDQVVYWRVDSSRNGSAADDPNTVTGDTWRFRTESSFPEITAQPADVVVFEGEPAGLTVEAVGTNPITLYEWYNSSDALVASGASLNTLTFEPATVEDSDSYYCIVINSQGKATQTEAASLYVKGLLAQYDFESTLADATGRFDGTAANTDPNATPSISFTEGISGSAAVLEGGSYIELPSDAYPNASMGLAQGTLACWVRTTTAGAIMASYNDGHTTCINLAIQAPERVYFYIRSETNQWSNIQVDVPGLLDGQWHLLTATYALGAPTVVYVDGEQVGTAGGLAASAEFAPWEYSLPIGAGDSRGVIGNVLDGAIDGLVLYNYPKTAKEVVDMYNALVEPDKSVCLNEYASAFDLAGPDGVGAEYADCRVDLYDFAALASAWLDCGLYPACGE